MLWNLEKRKNTRVSYNSTSIPYFCERLVHFFHWIRLFDIEKKRTKNTAGNLRILGTELYHVGYNSFIF